MPILRTAPDARVNTTTTNSQSQPAIATLADGSYVITWFSEDNGDLSDPCIRARIFNADGTPKSDDFIVNSTVTNEQNFPAITALVDGRFVVTYQSYDYTDGSESCIRARIFNADGSPVANDFIVNSSGLGQQYAPSIVAQEDGGFLVTWTSRDGGDGTGYCIRARNFDSEANPVGNDFVVNTTAPNEQILPDAALLSSGSTVIVWTSFNASPIVQDKEIRARIISPEGNPIALDFEVNANITTDRGEPAVTALAGDQFIVTWSTWSTQGEGDGFLTAITAQIFSNDGTKLGDSFLINSTTSARQADPDVIGLPDGRFIVVWNSSDDGDGQSSCLRLRLFDTDGTPIGNDSIVNSTTIGPQSDPQVTVLNDGRIVVTWSSGDTPGPLFPDSNIRSAIFDPNQIYQEPVLSNPLSDQSVDQGSLFNLALPPDLFTDLDPGDSLTYTVRQANGNTLPSWLTFDETSLALSGTPGSANVGTINVRINATDSYGNTAFDVFTLNVSNINDPPVVANALIDKSVSYGNFFSSTVPANTFTDPDVGDTLSYSATLSNGSSLPAWLNFNTNTRTFSGTPAVGNLGSLTILVTAIDSNGSSVSDEFVLSVINQAPVITNAIANQNVVEDIPFSFTVPANTFSDANIGTILTYTATLANGDPLSSWISFNAVTRVFSGTPFDAHVGTTTIKLTASDGFESVSDEFTINVANVSNIVTGTSANNNLVGTSEDDQMDGLGGNDVLAGLGGADFLSGGLGTDGATYVASATSVYVSLMAGTAYGGDAEGDTFAGIENLIGSNLDDILEGTNGNNVISGGLGIDTISYMHSLAGVRVSLSTTSAQNTLGAGTDTLTSFENVTGSQFSDNLTGNTGSNVLIGLAGNDTLNGGTGNSDTADYFYDPNGIIVNLNNGNANDGYGDTDVLVAIENVYGSQYNDAVTGNGQANFLWGREGNDTLNGGAGYDILQGDEGNDTLVSGDDGAWMVGGAGEDTLDGTSDSVFNYDAADYSDEVNFQGGTQGVIVNLSAFDQGTQAAGTATNSFGNQDVLIEIEEAIGTKFDDVMYARDLSGQNSTSTMTGLGGGDTLVGSDWIDRVRYDRDATNGGNASLGIIANFTSGSKTVGLETIAAQTVRDGFGDTDQVFDVENVWGTLNVDYMFGGTADEGLVGLKGNDILDGGDGYDIASYWRDDQYAGGANGVIANLSSLTRTVGKTSVSSGTVVDGFRTVDTLTNIEGIDGTKLNDTMFAGSLGNTLFGDAGNDTLNGGAGNDRMDGGTGTDTMVGGSGDDNYWVDVANDVVTELVGQGTDTINTSLVVFSLANRANVENLAYTGALNFNGTGNALSNQITGGAGNDTLNGGTGLDTLIGGLGNDTYVVDNAGDVVDETGGDGMDTVQTALAFSLAALGSIENLTLTGSAAVAGTGNGGNNVITGNTGINTLTGLGGNDTLNGLAGADTMVGGTGEDTYVVDNAGDIADETGGDGTDTVQSSLTFSLSDAVHAKGTLENLTLTGTNAINGTGNAQANIITGNTGNNILTGLGGADQLTGGVGTDTASYAASGAGVTVSLMTGLGTGGDAEGDTLFTIENLTGSSLDDTLEGSAGNNVLAGGLGIDTVSYANALAGVTVSLAKTSSQNTLGAGSDTLSGFENLTGSGLNDKLTGSTGNNVLRGGAGNDILAGGAGADTFDFSTLTDGSDVISDFATGVDDIGLIDLLGSAGLGGLGYATLIAQGNLVIQTGFFTTGLSSNSASTLDSRIYIDADGIGEGGSVLIATLEDTLTSASDFLV